MPRASKADVQYFLELLSTAEVATSLLGRQFRDARAAAEALASLAADPAALGEVLAPLPGGALEALRVMSEARRPLSEGEITGRLDRTLGRGRGKPAFQALRGRGFLGLLEQGFPRFAIWEPLRGPIHGALAGVDLVPVPEPEAGAVPDRGGMAMALLLGHLWRNQPKVKRDGAVFKKDATELDRIFGPAVGVGVPELFIRAFHALDLLALELREIEMSSSFRFAPAGDAGAFLAKPRAERVRAFAEAHVLPRWLSLVFAAGDNLLSRAALRRATAGDEVEFVEPAAADAWIGYCVAAGLLDELPGGVRVSAELRGRSAPARPSGGRWLVQPNLEVMVPPDVPLADAFRLACVAEIASLDRAAVLRITPASLSQAAEAGLSADEIVRRLEVRAGAPLPDLVVRSVQDGARSRPAAWVYTGTVAVVPEAAREAVRERFGESTSEIAPGVFLVAEHAEGRIHKMLSGLDLSVHQRSSRLPSSAASRGGFAAEELRALLETPPVAPADSRLVRAIERARAGDPVAFSRTERPVVNAPRPSSRDAPGEDDVDALLDAVLDRLEQKKPLQTELIPPSERQLFLGRLNRVLQGRAAPRAYGSTFVRCLKLLLAGAPAGTGPQPTAVASAPGEASAGTSGEHGAPPSLEPAWEPVAARAIAERLDLWLGLTDERRPRLVTPHRVVHREGGADLLALTHDSADLRVFAGARISGAAAGGASAEAHLAQAGAESRPVLRAARNDRCPCGSGRRYKACCLPADLAAAG